MADMTTLIVISSFIMFPAVMMAQEVVNHGVCPVPMNKEEEEIIKEQEKNREQMEEIMREIEISCLDECKTGLHNCHDDAYCTNTKLSFTCTCKPGYNGDGVNCADINECETGKHHCDADTSACYNTKGSFKCVCRFGFSKKGEHKCTDINECETGKHNCDNTSSWCYNFGGSFWCLCRKGYSRSGLERVCTDINECETGKHNCNATSSLCQNTKGSFRCACRKGYSASVPEHNCTVSSCKDIYDTTLKHENKAYLLNVESKQIPVYCHMEAAELGACGGGGWTLVMKINGSKSAFHYDSKLWTDKKDHNPSTGKSLLDHQETKLPTYWGTPFTKICLAMKIGHQVNSIVVNKQAISLHSLIADGYYRSTNLSRHTWKTLIGQQASLQRNCNQEGFNARGPGHHSRARIGIIGNEQNDCDTPDSRIGFGTSGYPGDNTCGNTAALHQPDNGSKNIKAMGYILVQ